MRDYAGMAGRAAEEIRAATAGVDAGQMEALIAALASAGRVVCYGVGREGLMMRALAMRLYHTGLDAHVVGDMSCPPVGAGDLLVVSAGPGAFSTVMGLVGVARDAGAKVACVTATPGGEAARASDLVLVIPAQTMANDQRAANDQGAEPSVLPMGSLFEGAQYLTFELLILGLRDHLGVDPGEMRARHTNLE